MEFKAATVKSTLYPFVLHVIGCDDDIECFKSLIDDSSDMKGYCVSFSDIRHFDYVDPTEYKLSGMTIFEWREENRALDARVRELESSYDRVIDEKTCAYGQLSSRVKCKPDYADLHAFIADL